MLYYLPFQDGFSNSIGITRTTSEEKLQVTYYIPLTDRETIITSPSTTTIYSAILEKANENERKIEELEAKLKTGLMKEGRDMIKDLTVMKQILFGQDGQIFIKEGKALVKQMRTWKNSEWNR